METQHTFSVVYAKKPGILLRLALVLERRGFTIESVTTLPYAPDPTYWEMVIAAEGPPAKWEQVSKQVSKLIDVLAIQEFKEV